jgi:hypothetical protein
MIITIEQVIESMPSYDLSKFLPEEWEGTLTDVLSFPVPHKHLISVACEFLNQEQQSEFARWCALQVTHLWDAPDVVCEFLETGNEDLKEAAKKASEDAPDSFGATSTGYATWLFPKGRWTAHAAAKAWDAKDTKRAAAKAYRDATAKAWRKAAKHAATTNTDWEDAAKAWEAAESADLDYNATHNFFIEKAIEKLKTFDK